MNNVFTADLHIFHDKVVEFSNRPWSAEEQTEKLVEMWNKQVKPKDNVYHLGDFVFMRNKKHIEVLKTLIRRLNGKKHFITGNHCDPKIWSMINEERDLCEWVKDYVKVIIDNQKVIMCHYAFRTWDCARYGSFNLYGHSHGNLPPIGKQLDVGIDNSVNVLGEHRLFEWDDIVEFMKERRYEEA